MKFDELFEQRSLVASKLKDVIRDMGYTKVSFASKADISRPTLDRLLNGSIDNKRSFDRHLQKILKLLNMTVEDLMLYHSVPKKVSTATVYSQNAPMNHEMSDKAKKQYDLLLDLIDLCAIYY
ncbi:helix-turn-helix transcriptional regulator [uncultured Catenibacterium sp.]|uniref:helix-turn-helix domain-containing protein n=1 Tax=uncultured Catenibacterium sp. TaxID=286142 RepID=UPI0025D57A84|nr:helix-turn-helix transcriptional regulator [uncultured Catenibacterium sp.]